MSQYPQLDSSFAESRRRGVSDDVMRTEALKIGWSLEDINAALASIPAPVVQAPPPPVIAPPIVTTVPAEEPVIIVQRKSHPLMTILIILLAVLVLLVGGGAYAYFAKIGPFEEVTAE